ncbi:hypothetical protein ABFS82_11G055500 [Erythranthe guttata]|uniref:Uncharacterized protein n=1 Tax=Erythranthe guttata TaxID=4155 RepID=A0A022QTP2_ERYGU|nr:PREDICTED: uncharacterized protein LOC105965444 [Erythranthe guttata]EYU30688.1 hypothetical protein MIMGU_mgv1a016295mg [Erythranthe guttata]|eukprot:XP_012845435.1 PREDICTED: uncharacterized protein LOC105965444 [Erythranthe guttata]
MASTGMLTFRPPAVVRASRTTASDGSRADYGKMNSSPNWWSPLFGFSSDPDYISPDDDRKSKPPPPSAAADEDPKPAKIRFSPGSFTEKKARQMRRMTNEAASFHDLMYHSAIATRLASDFSDRTDN